LLQHHLAQVYFNNELVFSKLATNQLPQPQELVRLLRAFVVHQAAAS